MEIRDKDAQTAEPGWKPQRPAGRGGTGRGAARGGAQGGRGGARGGCPDQAGMGAALLRPIAGQGSVLLSHRPGACNNGQVLRHHPEATRPRSRCQQKWPFLGGSEGDGPSPVPASGGSLGICLSRLEVASPWSLPPSAPVSLSFFNYGKIHNMQRLPFSPF